MIAFSDLVSEGAKKQMAEQYQSTITELSDS